jgi:hypothetical protein
MTRDDIIKLARQAGFDAECDTLCRYEGWVEPLTHFYHAAIEHFLQRSGQYLTNDASREAAIQQAVQAERKACADVVAGIAAGLPYPSHGHATAIQAVIAIRARGDK